MSKLDLTDPALLEALAAALTAAGVDGIDIEQPSGKLRLVLDAQSPRTMTPARQTTPARTQTAAGASQAAHLTAPMAGIFDLATVTGAFPRTVADGEILACLRVGPVLVPVRASQACTVTRCRVAPDSLVGFGDPLFDIEARS